MDIIYVELCASATPVLTGVCVTISVVNIYTQFVPELFGQLVLVCLRIELT